MRPIIFLGFHTFQGPFLVFCRVRMLVLLIVVFPCISQRVFVCSWYVLGISWAFSGHILGMSFSIEGFGAFKIMNSGCYHTKLEQNNISGKCLKLFKIKLLYK